MDKPLIVILDDWENGLARLLDRTGLEERARIVIHNRRLEGQDLLEALRPAQCVVLMRDRTPVDDALLERLPALRHILHTGTRNRKLDVAAARRRGIAVSCTGWGPSKASTCEATWALILAATRQLQSLALGPGRPWRDPGGARVLPTVLEGRRLGLIGLGQIGQRVARVGQALGMDVATWSPNMTQDRAAEHGATAVPLEELLASSDVLSLHLVPSAATHHLLDRERLAAMKPDSLLVNTSRAELIDTAALVHALEQGRPGFAALDVFDAEPLDPDHPLLRLPNVLLTPHIGFVSEPVYRRFAADLREGLLAWLEDGTIIREVAAGATA